MESLPGAGRADGSLLPVLRVFTLPDNVDDNGIKAEFKDGILNVRLPKTEKARPRGKEIKVK